MRKYTTLIVFSLFIAFSLASVFYAAPLGPLKPRTYYSLKSNYYLEVIPAEFYAISSIFPDPEIERYKKIYTNDECLGILYARSKNGMYTQKWKRILINEIAPAGVIVSYEGDYIVTFDNWNRLGYGNQAVVVYDGRDGSLISNYFVSDFVPSQYIDNFIKNETDMIWGMGHYIDEYRNWLILRIDFYVDILPVTDERRFKKQVIDLRTGVVLTNEGAFSNAF